MSQTFENNALKAKAVAEGMLKYLYEISRYDVNAEELGKLSEDADKAVAMGKEVNILRAEVSETKLCTAISTLLIHRDNRVE